MNTSSLRTGVAALLVLLCASAGGQQEPRAELQSFQSNDGYDEAALLQHAAGTAKFVAGREKFAPLEGEWLRLPLPAQFSLGTDNDSITLDLIVIEERGR